MPELPDVESFREEARKALKKRIRSVSIDRNRMFEVSERTLRRHLKGNRLMGTERRGKNLFLEISDGSFLVLHFGMSGDVSYAKEKPDHSIIVMELPDDYKLSIVSVRKLGKVDLTDDLDDYIEKEGLGPDALSIGKKEFVEAMKGCDGAVKGALMDQGRVAGIGNIYADEILYQSGVLPKRKTSEISEDKLKEMHAVMRRVLETAVRHHADTGDFPKGYFLRYRGRSSKCPKGEIKKTTVNGRTTYYCPEAQG